MPAYAYRFKPFDTHLRYTQLGGLDGELIWSRHGITEELLFIYDPQSEA